LLDRSINYSFPAALTFQTKEGCSGKRRTENGGFAAVRFQRRVSVPYAHAQAPTFLFDHVMRQSSLSVLNRECFLADLSGMPVELQR
jgi:hypothetical protein